MNSRIWRARLIEAAKSYRKANGERWREDDEAIVNRILHDALAVWRLHEEGEDDLVASLKAEFQYLEDEFTNTATPARAPTSRTRASNTPRRSAA